MYMKNTGQLQSMEFVGNPHTLFSMDKKDIQQYLVPLNKIILINNQGARGLENQMPINKSTINILMRTN